jgi:N-acetylglucosamine kinase-like BadF-type ATPase
VPVECVVGVDAGGSKCAAVAVDREGVERGAGSAGPGNPNGVGASAAARAMWTSAEEALRAAGGGRLEALGVGFAGAGSPRLRAELERELSTLVGAGRIFLCSDLEAAREGAFEGRAGVLVISGTGSSALAGDGAGRTSRAGGLGPRLGDEGSGYWIAARTLALALLAPPEEAAPLLAFYRGELAAAADADLPSAFHRAADLPVHVAALTAPLLARCGDHPLVARVLEAAAAELAALAARCAAPLGLDSPRVAGIGGLLQLGSPLRARFARALAAAVPGAALEAARRSPEWGAANLARASLGR